MDTKRDSIREIVLRWITPRQMGRMMIPLILIVPLLMGSVQGGLAQAPGTDPTPTPVLRLGNPEVPVVQPGVQEPAPVKVELPQATLNEKEIWPWGRANPEPKAANYSITSQQISADQLGMNAAPSSNNMQVISQIGGATYRVAVKGDYAYLGLQYRLAVMNVSNPAAPVLMGMTGTWPDKVLGVDVDDAQENVYVAAGNEGLRIVDVTNKRVPTEIGYYNNAPDGGYAWDVKLYASRVFIADGDAGLQIVDISNPKSPQKRGCFDTTGSAYDVDVFSRTVSGTTKIYAAIADETGGLHIVDVTNPDCSCPCPSGANSNCPVQVGSVAINGRAIGVTVSGNYAYVAADEGGLVVVDLTTVTAPAVVGTYDTPQHAYAVAVSQKNNIAYVADGNQDLIVVNIADPKNPTYVGFFGCCDTEGDCFANDIALSGSYAFLVDPAYGLRVLNAANPARLTQVYVFNSPAYTYGVQYQGYAYVSAGSAGLRVIEFPNYAVAPTPNYTDPREAGFFDTPGYAYAVQIAWPYAYVADGDRGLRIVNVSNPAAPHEVSYYDTDGEARDVVLYNGFAYVADKNQGVRVIDVRDPLNPVESISPPFNNDCRDTRAVFSADGYIYVADGMCGLHMFEAANPSHNASLDTLGPALDVAVAGNYIYVAAGAGGGMQIIKADINTSTSPATITLTPTGSYDTDGTASAVDIVGTTLFLADGTDGVRMFDVSNPASPVVTGFYDTRGSAGNIKGVLNAIFVADGDGGLLILEVPLSSVTSKISGTVVLNGNPLAGVTVSDGAGNSAATNAAGEYVISGLAAKTYTITAAKTGYTFTPASLSVKVPPDAEKRNFSASTNCLNGQVVDIKGRPVPGVTVTITGPSVYTLSTSATGDYSQCQVTGGRYTITPSKSKYTFYKTSETVDIPSTSSTRNFVGALPTSSPGGVITETQPSYVWEAVKDAVRYHLLVNGPKGNVIDEWYDKDTVCNVGLCIAKPDVTLLEGKYSWQVQSYGPTGVTAFGTEKVFSVSGIPAVALASPVNTIAEKNPSYVWYPVDGVVKYHLTVSSATSGVIDQWLEASQICTANSCTVKPAGDLAAGKYSWKVQTWSQTVDGPWSEALEFTVQ